MSNTPRLPSILPDGPVNFGTVFGHAAETMGCFGALYAEFWQNGTVSPRLKEMTRIRNARITDCGY